MEIHGQANGSQSLTAPARGVAFFGISLIAIGLQAESSFLTGTVLRTPTEPALDPHKGQRFLFRIAKFLWSHSKWDLGRFPAKSEVSRSAYEDWLVLREANVDFSKGSSKSHNLSLAYSVF
jgi:hypothetical protein